MEIEKLYIAAVRAKTDEDFQEAINAVPIVHRLHVLHTLASFHCYPGRAATARSNRILSRLEKEYADIVKN